MPRLEGSADLLEDRRKRALALLDSGYSLNEVGRRIGCIKFRMGCGAAPARRKPRFAAPQDDPEVGSGATTAHGTFFCRDR